MAIVLSEKKAFAAAQSVSRLQTLVFGLERMAHTVAEKEADVNGGFLRDVAASDCSLRKGDIDTSTWKSLNSMAFGIRRKMISNPIWTALKVLRNKGFDSYLVGGCVRDLVLRRTPKDFDVVTTAKLKQVNKGFFRSRIVGRKFPICHVIIQGTIIEVSSFETTSKDIKNKEEILLSNMPCNCDERNFLLWKNSMQRDFTINSLFYDPFSEKLYDYTGGLTDLKMSKLRTVIPAHLSFKEDCARILRGLRIAARLGLDFSKDTEAAIWDLSSSIVNLKKDRLMMELNFMLAYGAAEPSLCLLKKFRLLEILLPVQAAYLAQHDKNSSLQRSTMLMKLFSNMDKLLACDRPTNHLLWIALLAFHLALINQSQKAPVIWAFSSVLYHGKWEKAVDLTRKNFQKQIGFIPEIIEASEIASDELLGEEVSHLASLVKDSVNVLTGSSPLSKIMLRYTSSACSALFFISPKSAKTVSGLFDDLVTNIKFYDVQRSNFEINHNLLAKGDPEETRFVLGKVIMDTMCSSVSQAAPPAASDDACKSGRPAPPISGTEEMMETPAAKIDNVQNFNLPEACIYTVAKSKPRLKVAPISKAKTAAAASKPKPATADVKSKPVAASAKTKAAAKLKLTSRPAKALKTSAKASPGKKDSVVNKSIPGLSSLFM